VAGFAVLTEPFGQQVDRAMAYQPSDRKLPVILLSHPMQMIDEEAIRQRGKELADAAERLLNGITTDDFTA